MKRAFATVAFVAVILMGSGGVASADPEWCDSGSPPANDFRLRPTGGGSLFSSMSWLSSTTGGTLDLAKGINTLTGGVAHGMTQALQHARPWSSLPEKGYRANAPAEADDDDDDD